MQVSSSGISPLITFGIQDRVPRFLLQILPIRIEQLQLGPHGHRMSEPAELPGGMVLAGA
jgi:hypothetical protein